MSAPKRESGVTCVLRISLNCAKRGLGVRNLLWTVHAKGSRSLLGRVWNLAAARSVALLAGLGRVSRSVKRRTQLQRNESGNCGVFYYPTATDCFCPEKRATGYLNKATMPAASYDLLPFKMLFYAANRHFVCLCPLKSWRLSLGVNLNPAVHSFQITTKQVFTVPSPWNGWHTNSW